MTEGGKRINDRDTVIKVYIISAVSNNSLFILLIWNLSDTLFINKLIKST